MLKSSQPEPNEEKNKAIAETLGAGLQSIFYGRGNPINKGIVNITGSVTGNGNGSIYVTVNNVRNYYYSYPPHSPQSPPEPTHEPSSREYGGSGYNNKFLENKRLDNASTNAFLLSKSSPSIPSSSYDRSFKINSSSISQPSGKAKVTCSVCKKELVVSSIDSTAYYCHACQERSAITKSISVYEQSRKEKDDGANMLKHNNINANLLLIKPIPSTSSFSSSLSKRGNRRAVLWGVTYGKRKYRLRGTINDINNMKALLVENFKFPIDCIRVLSDETNHVNLSPTKRNILESLKWLVEDSQPGDSLVFYLSKHGLRQDDSGKDEIDGFDETICPVDDSVKGEMISGDEINSTIVWPVKKGVTLHVIVDGSYRGTIPDLIGIWNWEDNKPAGTIRKHTSGGLVICLSACEDSKVLTYLITKIIRDCPGITYGNLLNMMHGEIAEAYSFNMHNRIFQRMVAQDQPETDEENYNALGVGFQSILDGSVKQINKGAVNLTGRVIGNGNGSIHVTVTNVRNYYSSSQPLLPSYDQSREDSSGAKLFKHVHWDNANRNGTSASKSYLSTTSSSSLSSTRNKLAVLCGVTYGKRKFSLEGTINDVLNMKELLVKNFKFPIDCIRILTEEAREPYLIPTRRNILDSLRWLVKDCQPGDSLVFYFSGHGLKQADSNNDEIDGFDEALCPVDFMKEGTITDDEINSIIVRPLTRGVTLHAIVDAGHSGTVLDLIGIWKWENGKPFTVRKHTMGGLAICLSACEDSQVATDTKAFGQKRMSGVLTNLLTKTIRDCPGITYGSLLNMIHSEIKNINGSDGFMKLIFQRKVARVGFPLLAIILKRCYITDSSHFSYPLHCLIKKESNQSVKTVGDDSTSECTHPVLKATVFKGGDCATIQILSEVRSFILGVAHCKGFA
ncbi:hypothetical protein RIF29_41615 [Crotalaria pallida]|uniref:Peptidase C14 caspase domain-containing protein n=1 Tax=Crotalaria pallida TaxID=3830 RepID=A0AAN9EAW8_CROPI